jgi:hypothetical protein
MLHDVSDGGIGYQADPPGALVMIAHESEMGHHCTETVPSRKRRRVDDEAGETAGFFDVGATVAASSVKSLCSTADLGRTARME